MKRKILLLILMTLLLLPVAVQAQEAEIELETVFVQLWPEFDRPEMLIIMKGKTTEATALPVTLTFILPPDADLNAVAHGSSSGGVVDAADVTFEDGVLTMISPDGSFQIEYYDLALRKDGADRLYNFDLNLGYRVEQMLIEAQVPLESSDFTMEPSGQPASELDNFGLATQGIIRENVAASETISITISYSKPDNSLTIDLLESVPVIDAESAQTSNEEGNLSLTTILLAGAGILAILGGAILFLKEKQITISSRGYSKKKAKPSRAGKFCTQCGKPLNRGDQFCRSCGMKAKG